jgi:hypothetical protein
MGGVRGDRKEYGFGVDYRDKTQWRLCQRHLGVLFQLAHTATSMAENHACYRPLKCLMCNQSTSSRLRDEVALTGLR